VPVFMQIAELTKIGRIEYRQVPVPKAGPGEIVIKTRAVGLCGTDLKAFVRGHPYFKPPCVLGHEFAGTIAEVGEGVKAFAVGEAVIAAPYVECGQCDLCLRDLGELCKHKAFISGALQEYILVPREIVNAATIRLPEGVDFITGSLAEPLACVVNGIEKASIESRDSVLVVGGGPMGALLAQMARSITLRVAVSEIAPARISALRNLDLTVIDPSQKDTSQQLEDQFKVTIDPFAVHYQEVSIVGSFGYRLDHFRTAISWLSEHPKEATRLVTHTVPFEKVEAGFEIAQRGDGLKTIVVFGEGDES